MGKNSCKQAAAKKGRRGRTGALTGAPGAGARSLESLVWELPLTGKERRALFVLGVLTVRDFLDLDVRRVLKFKGFGAITYARLNASQEAARKKSLPDQGEHDQTPVFLRSNVARLGLNPRGLDALAQRHVHTIAGFLALDLENRPPDKNYGSVAVRELAGLQRSLRQRLPSGVLSSLIRGDWDEVPQPGRLAASRSEMTGSSWKLLPLFLGEPLGGVRADELHASFRPGILISHLCLGAECEQVLTAVGIRSLGQLLLTPHGRLRGPDKLSGSCLAWLQALVVEFLCEPMERTPPPLDYSTPENFLASLVAPVLTDDRQRRVFLDRIGWRGPRRTLEALAQEYGVSRERIRQIEGKARKKFLHWRARIAMAPLHDFVVSLLSGHSGPLSLVLVCRRLQEQYKWPRPLREVALEKLLSAFPDLNLVGGEYVVIA